MLLFFKAAEQNKLVQPQSFLLVTFLSFIKLDTAAQTDHYTRKAAAISLSVADKTHNPQPDASAACKRKRKRGGD